MKRLWPILFLLGAVVPELAFAQELAPALDQAWVEGASAVSGVDLQGDPQTSTAVRLLVVLTALSFLPAVLLVMTPFTRFVIVFSLLRQSLGLQQSPPNQVLVGLSLMLSMLVMSPTLTQVNELSVEPYLAGELSTTEAIEAGLVPLRGFMLSNTRKEDMATVLSVSHEPRPASIEQIETPAVISAFVLSELKTSFIIAIKVAIPFLVVDMVVASVLLGMGMMVLPPVVISLPFKLLLFVLMDGWGLLVSNMVASFN